MVSGCRRLYCFHHVFDTSGESTARKQAQLLPFLTSFFG